MHLSFYIYFSHIFFISVYLYTFGDIFLNGTLCLRFGEVQCALEMSVIIIVNLRPGHARLFNTGFRFLSSAFCHPHLQVLANSGTHRWHLWWSEPHVHMSPSVVILQRWQQWSWRACAGLTLLKQHVHIFMQLYILVLPAVWFLGCDFDPGSWTLWWCLSCLFWLEMQCSVKGLAT